MKITIFTHQVTVFIRFGETFYIQTVGRGENPILVDQSPGTPRSCQDQRPGMKYMKLFSFRIK